MDLVEFVHTYAWQVLGAVMILNSVAIPLVWAWGWHWGIKEGQERAAQNHKRQLAAARRTAAEAARLAMQGGYESEAIGPLTEVEKAKLRERLRIIKGAQATTGRLEGSSLRRGSSLRQYVHDISRANQREALRRATTQHEEA